MASHKEPSVKDCDSFCVKERLRRVELALRRLEYLSLGYMDLPMYDEYHERVRAASRRSG